MQLTAAVPVAPGETVSPAMTPVVKRASHGRRVGLLLASVVLHALSFPPWSLWPLAFVALVPLLRALDGLSAMRAALVGLAWGTLAIWGVGWWVPAAIAGYYDQPIWFGVLFSMAASIVFAGSYYAGFAATAAVVVRGRSSIARVSLLTAAWVSWELARARLLTGDPWLLLGYALIPVPTLIQAADLGGVYLLSAAIFVCNAAVSEVIATCSSGRWRRDGWRTVVAAPAFACVVVAVSWLYGAWRLAQPLPATPRVPVSIVQSYSGVGSQWNNEYYGRGLEQYLQLSESSARRAAPRLIFWPESAITFFLEEEPAYRASIAHALGFSEAELVIGGPHHEALADGESRYFNSAFLLSPSGEIQGRYDKRKLLPFAEYFPLRTIEFLRRRFERVRSFSPGDHREQLETRAGRAAVAICFEAIFPEIVRARMAEGARFLVNLSNDAWLGHGPGPEQHFSMVVLRAVENRTWIVRATTTGVSAIVDPQGRVVLRAPSGVSATLEDAIVPGESSSFYQSVGDLFAYACAVAVLVAALLARPRR